MSEQGLRDVERWKDKIEVRLDNRQVFFLFFGSALVACLLFVLGVIVGKRLESRGRAAAPEIEDPLALLDKVAVSARAPEPTPAPKTTAAPAARLAHTSRPAPRGDEPAAGPAAERAEPRVDGKPAPRPELKAVAGKAPASTGDKTTATGKPFAGQAEKAAVAAGGADKPPVVAKPKPIAAAATGPSAAPATTLDGKPKGHFTLQIGAFQDRAEAVAYAGRFGAAGKTYIVAADIPGKGLWHKVRMGEFATAKEAAAAKAAFEKEHNSIALVAPK